MAELAKGIKMGKPEKSHNSFLIRSQKSYHYFPSKIHPHNISNFGNTKFCYQLTILLTIYHVALHRYVIMCQVNDRKLALIQFLLL